MSLEPPVKKESAMASASARFDQIAKNYASSEVHSQSPTLRRLVEILQPTTGISVCDIACGAGHTGLSFAGVASKIVGVDPAPSMLAAFQELAKGKGIAVEGVESYAESIPQPDNTFDVAVSRLAPHHFTDIKKAMSEMTRITKPGGAVAVIDLEGDPDPASDDFNHQLEILHDPTHIRSYTAATWQSFFESAGLKIEHVERQLSEKPGGVPVSRWCQIAASGDAAEASIRRLLDQASPELLDRLGISRSGDEYMMPVRTVLIVGRKPGE